MYDSRKFRWSLIRTYVCLFRLIIVSFVIEAYSMSEHHILEDVYAACRSRALINVNGVYGFSRIWPAGETLIQANPCSCYLVQTFVVHLKLCRTLANNVQVVSGC